MVRAGVGNGRHKEKLMHFTGEKKESLPKSCDNVFWINSLSCKGFLHLLQTCPCPVIGRQVAPASVLTLISCVTLGSQPFSELVFLLGKA